MVEGEEGGKRKRKLKDPNAPKRPPSSYILYQNEIRQQIKKEHPEMTNSELLAFISKQWAEMDESEKAVCPSAHSALFYLRSNEPALSLSATTTCVLQRRRHTRETRLNGMLFPQNRSSLVRLRLVACLSCWKPVSLWHLQRKVQMAHAGSISEDADAAHDEDEGHEDDEDDDEISQSGQLGAGKPMSFNGRQKTKKMRH